MFHVGGGMGMKEMSLEQLLDRVLEGANAEGLD
jgi:hypothetical protein